MASRGGAFRVRIEGVEKTSAEFKEARKKIRRDVRGHVIEIGSRIILPSARQAAPSIAASHLTVKATGSSGYLGVQGARRFDRIIGLWNFGGTVKTPIKPVTKKALAIRGTGIVIGAVKTPRHYRGTRKLEKVVNAHASHYFSELTKAIMQAFDPIEHTP